MAIIIMLSFDSPLNNYQRPETQDQPGASGTLASLKNFMMKNTVVKRPLTKVLSYLISHEHFVFL